MTENQSMTTNFERINNVRFNSVDEVGPHKLSIDDRIYNKYNLIEKTPSFSLGPLSLYFQDCEYPDSIVAEIIILGKEIKIKRCDCIQ
jgi:hypothetical protein